MVIPLATSQTRLLRLRSVVVVPILATVCACSQADAPKMADAPPPPAPKSEELKVPKIGAGKTQYGANEKYQRAMEKLGKQGRSQ